MLLGLTAPSGGAHISDANVHSAMQPVETDGETVWVVAPTAAESRLELQQMRAAAANGFAATSSDIMEVDEVAERWFFETNGATSCPSNYINAPANCQ